MHSWRTEWFRFQHKNGLQGVGVEHLCLKYVWIFYFAFFVSMQKTPNSISNLFTNNVKQHDQSVGLSDIFSTFEELFETILYICFYMNRVTAKKLIANVCSYSYFRSYKNMRPFCLNTISLTTLYSLQIICSFQFAYGGRIRSANKSLHTSTIPLNLRRELS